jgi:kynurenine formamidase
MPEQNIPSAKDIEKYLTTDNNWGRWGKEDELGAMNFITPEKVLSATQLVTKGKRISLSRPLPTTPGPGNPTPAHHFMMKNNRPNGGGAATDYYGVAYHGQATTHIDALCHVWDSNGMWNGKNPNEEITFNGTQWGSIEHWKEGIITRGILLDVPKHRGTDYVTHDRPVHGWELQEIVEKENIQLSPGDAIIVYSGREKWNEENDTWGTDKDHRPGLHASCLKFLKDSDCCLLVWDMMDHAPNGYGLPWSVHAAIFAYGIGLLDNALLQPLSEACKQEKRYEFLLTVNPLVVEGGTGSPVNPIAIF